MKVRRVVQPIGGVCHDHDLFTIVAVAQAPARATEHKGDCESKIEGVKAGQARPSGRAQDKAPVLDRH